VSANEEDVMTDNTDAPTATEAAPEAPTAAETAVGTDDAPVVETVVAVPATPAPTGPATRSRSAKSAKGSSHLAQTVGRRKEAIVRVRMISGTGTFTLNGRALESYFPNKVHQQLVREPLVITEKAESFDIIANLRGGGITGQAGALRLAVARALIEVNPDDRPALKKAGFLTRDARVTESKKYGLKKARKAPQYSKR
jgi:small subunit ribosomal protein S9